MSQAPVTAEDLYLYALGLLDPEEHARIEEFLPKSPEARAELANVRGDLALFALGTEMQEVPSTSRERLLQQVALESRQATSAPAAMSSVNGVTEATATSSASSSARAESSYTPSTAAAQPTVPVRSYVEDPQPRRGFFSLFLPWAGWACAAGLAFSTWTYYQRTQALQDSVASANASAAQAVTVSARAQEVLDTLRSTSAQRVVLTAASVKPVPSARVTYVASTGSLVFQGNNLDPVDADKVYELWLIPKGTGAKPIPAGTFKPDARGFASVILPELPRGTEAAAFGVTLEKSGGSQTPTMPILLVGTA